MASRRALRSSQTRIINPAPRGGGGGGGGAIILPSGRIAAQKFYGWILQIGGFDNVIIKGDFSAWRDCNVVVRSFWPEPCKLPHAFVQYNVRLVWSSLRVCL